MSLLTPLFLLGLAGLALPILIHLTQRERRQVVKFPSLMFVRRIPYQSVRRRSIRNWLLLMVRLAALALVVFAFARPFFTGGDLGASVTGAREVVILLDRSYSMGYADRWDRAAAAAREVIDDLEAADRATIVLFASSAEIALRSTAERDRLLGALDVAAPGGGATRYAPALKVAAGVLGESSLPRREVVLISDFQRGGWRGEEGARLPAGATLTPVRIDGGDGPNLTATSVSLSRSTFSDQERVAVTASFVNRGTEPVPPRAVTLEVDGRVIGTAQVEADEAGAPSVTFDPFTVTGRTMRGTVRLADDALAADNVFHFVITPSEPVRVALVQRAAGPGADPYLAQALAIGDEPRFETTVRTPEALSDQDLARASVVLLVDAPVSTALARRLEAFVARGGGLMLATGPRSSWPDDVDLLPGVLAEPVDRTSGVAARVGAIEFAHPLFEPFRAPRSGDFTAARFYGYRSITAAPEADVLARFDAGSPALLERRAGQGRVLLWASTLDMSWSDLPLRPVYLPFVHRAMLHLSSYREPATWRTVGDVLDSTSAGDRVEAGLVALTPSGGRLSLDEEGAAVFELTEQGFYEIRVPQAPDAETQVTAANVDPAEADLTAMEPQELIAAALAVPSAEADAAASAELSPETREGSQRLWWFLLLAGVILLGIDTLVSNRLSRA
ncbi:MAG: VWA domain-containing protein [Acidobacteria bacterium]|nr:VWA domain-containing protein [Acidobacteriota bacterium]